MNFSRSISGFEEGTIIRGGSFLSTITSSSFLISITGFGISGFFISGTITGFICSFFSSFGGVITGTGVAAF
jgi:hypothetical protein